MYGNLTVARQLPPDPRQKDWLMMQSPIPNLVISLIYIYAVTVWGPRYMSKRKPVPGLRPYMMAYNAFQVVFSAYLFLEVKKSDIFSFLLLLMTKIFFCYVEDRIISDFCKSISLS